MTNTKKTAIYGIFVGTLALFLAPASNATIRLHTNIIHAFKAIRPKRKLIRKYKWIRETATSNNLRKFPYPYKAMLSISSDIDDTTLKEFETYHRYLNTNANTPYGKGLGMDIGDSFWVFMGSKSKIKTDATGGTIKDVMTFCQGLNPKKLHNGKKIIEYLKCGWIDTLHTFGDFSATPKDNLCTRDYAVKAWEVMSKYNIHPTIWINHGTPANKQNFGASTINHFFNYQEGDLPRSPYYHTDIGIKNGIHYLWDSESSSVFGVDYPMYILNTRDGQKLWGFHRYTNEGVYIEKVSKTKSKICTKWVWDTPTFYEEITSNHLDNLIRNHQYSIIAQHLGLGNKGLFPFNKRTIRQLKLLDMYQKSKKILIARTSRLLNYALSQRYVNFEISYSSNNQYINILKINDPIFGPKTPSLDDLRGLTFYSSYPKNSHILLENKEIPRTELQINPPDETGKRSVSIKWFKSDITDYTKQMNY